MSHTVPAMETIPTLSFELATNSCNRRKPWARQRGRARPTASAESDEYLKPELFFGNTYPTRGLSGAHLYQSPERTSRLKIGIRGGLGFEEREVDQ